MRRKLLFLPLVAVLAGCGSSATTSQPAAPPPPPSKTEIKVSSGWVPMQLPNGVTEQVEAVTINGQCFVATSNGDLFTLTLAQSGQGNYMDTAC